MARRRPIDGPSDAERAEQTWPETNRARPFRRRRLRPPVQSRCPPRESASLARRQARPDTHHRGRRTGIRRAQLDAAGLQRIRRRRPSPCAMASRSFSCSWAIVTIDVARFRSTARRGRTARSLPTPFRRRAIASRSRRRCRRLHSTQIRELAIGLAASSRPAIDVVEQQPQARQIAMASARTASPGADAACAPRPTRDRRSP